MICCYITDPENTKPKIPGNDDRDGWIRLCIEGKRERRQRSWSRTAKRQKRWDAVDCAIEDNDARYCNDSNLSTAEEHLLLDEECLQNELWIRRRSESTLVPQPELQVRVRHLSEDILHG